MLILIKNATILSPQSKYHNSKKDILIKNGEIQKIASRITEAKAKLITSQNLHISLGWIDVGTSSGEPGFEHRESLDSLSQAAAAGGYTALAIFPNTQPVIDNKSSVQYILNSTKDHIVDYFPIGALSKNCQGEDITEMIDMTKNGAIAFSDGVLSVKSNGLLLRALEYIKSTDGVIIHRPEDHSISNGNDIHEGQVSTSLGLKASPSLSEFLTVERDIQLATYAESKLLVHGISAKESVEKLVSNKSKNITCSVNYLNLCLTEEAIQTFDTNCKVSPPLRHQSDKDALIKALNTGTIDIIASNHIPLEEELKKKEFVYAEAGAIGLQTCFSGILSHAQNIKLDKVINCLTIKARKVLGISIPEIEIGAVANLTLFDPEEEWVYDNSTNLSKSKNSPFWNQNMKGKVIGIVNGKQSHFNNY